MPSITEPLESGGIWSQEKTEVNSFCNVYVGQCLKKICSQDFFPNNKLHPFLRALFLSSKIPLQNDGIGVFTNSGQYLILVMRTMINHHSPLDLISNDFHLISNTGQDED